MSGCCSAFAPPLEVLVMGVFVVRPMKQVSVPLLALGFALFAGYFLLALLWPTLLSLYLGQILRAAAIGILSVVGMAYVQELLPGRAGIASALFGNTMRRGLSALGLGTGLFAQALWLLGDFRGLCGAVRGSVAACCSGGQAN